MLLTYFWRDGGGTVGEAAGGDSDLLCTYHFLTYMMSVYFKFIIYA